VRYKNIRGRKKLTREEREIQSLTKFSVEQTKVIKEQERCIDTLKRSNRHLEYKVKDLIANRYIKLNLLQNDYGRSRVLRLQTDLPKLGVEVTEDKLDFMRFDGYHIPMVVTFMMNEEFPKVLSKIQSDFRTCLEELLRNGQF
jgi:hypothetical protein